MKKFILTTMALTLLASTTTFASEIEKMGEAEPYANNYVYSSQGQSFNSAWSKTAGGSGWSINYGYNTAFINEDYTHAKNSYDTCMAEVYNGNGSHVKAGSKGDWAKIEVKHKMPTNGNQITYTIKL